MNNYLLIFIGGGVGSIARYALSRWVYAFTNSTFPYGTLIVNIVSCLILGFFLELANEKFLIHPSMKIFVAIGFCGGFSTFSTFSFETFELLKSGQYWFATANVVVSIVSCMLSLAGGMFVAKIV